MTVPGQIASKANLIVETRARPGDVIARRFATIEADENTRHVMIVADTPAAIGANIYSVRVYDSAATPHFDDTRGSAEGQFPSGVGTGQIHFRTDGEGRPIAFLFAPPATAEFVYLPIAIGQASAIQVANPRAPMSTQSQTSTPFAASASGTVLDNLKPDSPLQAQISATLNAALKTQPAAAATTAKLPALVGLINSMPEADLVAAKDLKLRAFVQQKADPILASDPAMKIAIDNGISISSAIRNKRRGRNIGARPGAQRPIPETRNIGPSIAHERGRFQAFARRTAASSSRSFN